MTRKGFKTILIRENVKQKLEELAKRENAKSLCSFITKILEEYVTQHSIATQTPSEASQ